MSNESSQSIVPNPKEINNALDFSAPAALQRKLTELRNRNEELLEIVLEATREMEWNKLEIRMLS
jgi:type VI protein secretion system component VasA